MKKLLRTLTLSSLLFMFIGVIGVQADPIRDAEEQIRVLDSQLKNESTYLDELYKDKSFIESELLSIKECIDITVIKVQNAEFSDKERLEGYKSELIELTKKEKIKNQTLEEINTYISNTKSSVNYLENEIRLRKEELEDIKLIEASKKPTVEVPTSDRGTQVIEYAKRFLGTPYVYGGTSSKGFDCSGFTQYMFREALGIKLGRTTYDQIKSGPAVSRTDLKPGDLVFFGSWSNPYHVGIYVGDGKYIHSPRTGDVVKIVSLSGTEFFTGIRVIK